MLESGDSKPARRVISGVESETAELFETPDCWGMDQAYDFEGMMREHARGLERQELERIARAKGLAPRGRLRV